MYNYSIRNHQYFLNSINQLLFFFSEKQLYVLKLLAGFAPWSIFRPSFLLLLVLFLAQICSITSTVLSHGNQVLTQSNWFNIYLYKYTYIFAYLFE